VTARGAARTAGIAYLLIIASGVFAEFFVRGRLVVAGDAGATAANIMASESLFRLGLASDLVMIASDVLVAVAFYVLLRPVSQPLALLAAALRLVQASVLGANMLNHATALQYVSGADYLAAVAPAELHALALRALEAHAVGYQIGLVFFGAACLVLGHLLFVSRYVPRVLAVLLVCAGGVYLVGSLVTLLAPRYESGLMPLYVVPFVAELVLALWLVVKGVRVGSSEGVGP
jgi:hypothetical protein